jgi:hypothetical protein
MTTKQKQNKIKKYAMDQDNSILNLYFEDQGKEVKVGIERRATKGCTYYSNIGEYINLSIEQAQKELDFFKGLI